MSSGNLVHSSRVLCSSELQQLYQVRALLRKSKLPVLDEQRLAASSLEVDNLIQKTVSTVSAKQTRERCSKSAWGE